MKNSKIRLNLTPRCLVGVVHHLQQCNERDIIYDKEIKDKESFHYFVFARCKYVEKSQSVFIKLTYNPTLAEFMCVVDIDGLKLVE